MYAILSHGGRQHRVSAGDRLVVDRLDAAVGSMIALEPVLLTGGAGATRLGGEVEGVRVAVTVVKHLRGEKLRIFKYKPKKRSRKAAGYRSELTELRVESILSKGAELPAVRAADKVVAGKPTVEAASAPAAAATEEAADVDAVAEPVEPAAAGAPAEPAPAEPAAGKAAVGTRAPRRRTAARAAKAPSSGEDGGDGA